MADKPKKFIKGHNALKPKTVKTPKIDKKKAEELERAAVLNEYIADFQASAAAGKTFVRAGVIDPNKSIALQPQQNAEQKSVYDNSKLFKPKSKMAELAEEFKKSKEISTEYQTAKQDINKKKTGEKKKSNLELFKEELEKSQQERDIRRRIKKGDLSGISESMINSLPPTFFKQKGADDDFNFQYEAGNAGASTDPSSTNLFVSNLNPKMNEDQLCRVFGKYGPLASVKIMWPRTEDEKSRNKNCGFVAFMNRADGERCLADIEGKDVMDYEMKIGWGKSVPIPPVPIYIHPSHSQAVRPPKQSGLPFNCQLPHKLRKTNEQFDGNLENTIVKVVIPTERTVISVINRVVEFVVREGPMFEAMIMNKELQNPNFRFLFDNKSNEHIYYRWRIFSLLQGDTTHKWQQECFRMFKGGSLWQPPKMNPFKPNSAGLTSQTQHAPPGGDMDLAAKKNMLLEHLNKNEEDEERANKKEEKILSDSHRDTLEDLLRTLTTSREKIGDLMFWSIDHSDYCHEIVECVCESLSILETPLPTKVARLFVVSDILYNSSAKVRNASSYRKYFQEELLEVMEHLHKALTTCSTKSQAEKFRKQVLSCLAAWQDWSIYPPNFLISLQNVFVGISTAASIKKEAEEIEEQQEKAKEQAEDDVDGEPLEDDIDGMPLEKDMEGVPMDLIDGVPLTKEEKSIDKDDPLSSSRWTRVAEHEEEAKNKWEKVEGVKMGKSKTPPVEETPPSPGGPMDEERRKFLREVELKVVRFVDKLEQRGANRSGLNIQKEAAKFRKQLIQQYEESRAKAKDKRESSESPRRRKRKKNYSSESSDSETSRRSSRKNRGNGRSPRRQRSVSRSPKRTSSRSPKRTSSRSPRRNLSRSPKRAASRSPRRALSRSPKRTSSRSPRRDVSRSPIFSPRRTSASPSPPARKKSPLRSCGRSPSPKHSSRYNSRSPSRSLSPKRSSSKGKKKKSKKKR